MNQLFDTFPKPDRSQWTKAAAAEISGKNPFEELVWKTPDQQEVKPFYSLSDLENLHYLEPFSFINQSGGLSGARSWANIPPVKADDAVMANKIALEHLQHEAEGILFTPNSGSLDYNQLLDQVAWEHCTVSFVGNEFLSLSAIEKYITAKKYNQSLLQGAIFWKNGFATTPSLPAEHGFKRAGIYVEASTPSSEIASALAAGVNLINRFTEAGGKKEVIINHIAFSIPVGSQLMLDISKLKALRMLWYQVVQAYGVSYFQPADLYLHGRSEVWINPAFQPHGNLLKSTLAAIAAVSGSCNALTICPEDEQNTTMRRIARNTSVILKEEAHFNKTNDPFAGAYGAEILTDQIARDAWKLFQTQTQLAYETRL